MGRVLRERKRVWREEQRRKGRWREGREGHGRAFQLCKKEKEGRKEENKEKTGGPLQENEMGEVLHRRHVQIWRWEEKREGKESRKETRKREVLGERGKWENLEMGGHERRERKDRLFSSPTHARGKRKICTSRDENFVPLARERDGFGRERVRRENKRAKEKEILEEESGGRR